MDSKKTMANTNTDSGRRLTTWEFVEANNGRILSDGVRSLMRLVEFGESKPIITITDAEREKLQARRHRAIKAAAARRALSVEARGAESNPHMMAISMRESMPEWIKNYCARAAYFPRFNAVLDNGELLYNAGKVRRHLIDNRAAIEADDIARTAAAAELKTIDGKSGGAQITIQLLRRMLQRDYKIMDARSMRPLSPAADIYTAAYNAAYRYTLNGYDIKYQRVKKTGEYRAVTKFQAAKAAAGHEVRMHKNASAYTSEKVVKIPARDESGEVITDERGNIKMVTKLDDNGEAVTAYTVSPFVFFDARESRDGLNPLEQCYIRVPADDGEDQFLAEEESKSDLLEALKMTEREKYIINALQHNKTQSDISASLGVSRAAVANQRAKVAARVEVVTPDKVRGYKSAIQSKKGAEAARAARAASDAAEDARIELLNVDAANAAAYTAKIDAARAAYNAERGGAAERKLARDAASAAMAACKAAAAVEALTVKEAERVREYINAHTTTARGYKIEAARADGLNLVFETVKTDKKYDCNVSDYWRLFTKKEYAEYINK